MKPIKATLKVIPDMETEESAKADILEESEDGNIEILLKKEETIENQNN